MAEKTRVFHRDDEPASVKGTPQRMPVLAFTLVYGIVLLEYRTAALHVYYHCNADST